MLGGLILFKLYSQKVMQSCCFHRKIKILTFWSSTLYIVLFMRHCLEVTKIFYRIFFIKTCCFLKAIRYILFNIDLNSFQLKFSKLLYEHKTERKPDLFIRKKDASAQFFLQNILQILLHSKAEQKDIFKLQKVSQNGAVLPQPTPMP